MGDQNKALGFVKDHKVGVIIAVVAVVVLAITFGLSSKFILDSRDSLTSTFNLSMHDEADQQIDVAAFTREDGNLSMTFSGNVMLFQGARGSVQGTMQDEYTGGGVHVVRLEEPYYDRTLYLRAAHYTTYVLMPESGSFGIWGVRVVDDNGVEPDVCYWMNLESEGTVRMGTAMPGDGWDGIIAGIRASEEPASTWEYNEEGLIQFTDAEARTFTLDINASIF